MSKRAGIYARVSRAYREDDERLTIESQLEDCRAYCASHGYQVVGEWVDNLTYRGDSGKIVNPSGERKDRPGYKALLKTAREGGLDVIVAWKEDRLYRGLLALYPLFEALEEKRGLTVELVTEKFDQKLLGIKANIAKIELDNIRDRMVRGRQARIERGGLPGGPVRYGYRRDENKELVIHETEAEIIRMVFDLYASGKKPLEIRRILHAGGYKPQSAKLWSRATIDRIVTFEGYATGEYTTRIQGKTYAVKLPVIITPEAWQRAQSQRRENKTDKVRNVKHEYLCRSLVVCSCGRRWNINTSGPTHRGAYVCTRLADSPELRADDCPGKISSHVLDAHVWQVVSAVCERPDLVQTALTSKITEIESTRAEIQISVDQIGRALDDVEQERFFVISLARKGAITEDDLKMQLDALGFQTLDLKRKQAEQAAALTFHEQTEAVNRWAVEYITGLADGVRALSLPVGQMTPGQKTQLYDTLQAARFEDKFEGDKIQALEWAVIEEKRRIVKSLVKRVFVTRDKNGKKLIKPELSVDLPAEVLGLDYNHECLYAWSKSPAYRLDLPVNAENLRD